MNMGYFGDSYDLVKRTFITWLNELGPWHVQPMFTDEVSEADANRFARFIGAALVSSAQLTAKTNRKEFFRSARVTGNLFLDPDTGIRAKAAGKKSPCYITYSEVADLVAARPQWLTMVYDQSVARAKKEPLRDALRGKLATLKDLGVLGFYYVSHAPLLIATSDRDLLETARAHLLRYLPEDRILGPREGDDALILRPLPAGGWKRFLADPSLVLPPEFETNEDP